MSIVRVVFQTKPVPVEPDKQGPFAGYPQTKCITYARYFDIDMSELDVLPPRDKVKFYGDEYKVISLGVNRKEIGVLVTEGQLVRFLTKAKTAGHRWKVKVLSTVDARRVIQQTVHRMMVH